MWRPLGELLVSNALLTEEQLERALEEQARTGRRLGEVVVEHGYVDLDDLTKVLLQQCGIDLSTQDGFGSGLRDTLERRRVERRPFVPPRPPEEAPAPVPDVAEPVVATVAVAEPEVRPEREAEPEAEPEPVSVPVPVPQPRADHDAAVRKQRRGFGRRRRNTLQTGLEAMLADLDRRGAELQQGVADLRRIVAELHQY